jgi:hypothetical protein
MTIKETTQIGKIIIMPWIRVAILVTALTAICILSYFITESTIPTAPKNTIIFPKALLLIVLGTTLFEYKFTKPADSALNWLLGFITLIPESRT